MEVTDSFGNVVTKTIAVTILAQDQTYTLAIYNSAGEVVDTLAVTNYTANAPPRSSPTRPRLWSARIRAPPAW